MFIDSINLSQKFGLAGDHLPMTGVQLRRKRGDLYFQQGAHGCRSAFLFMSKFGAGTDSGNEEATSYVVRSHDAVTVRIPNLSY